MRRVVHGFIFSITEALAAGRPIVASPTNGTAAYVGAALYGLDAARSA